MMDNKSRMMGDCQVRFCERPKLKCFCLLDCSGILSFVAESHCIALRLEWTRRLPSIVRRVLPSCTILADAETRLGRNRKSIPTLPSNIQNVVNGLLSENPNIKVTIIN